ncbi:MAG TPA: flagellar biosynthesis protein FlhB [Pirellulales bacterium]|nr:flagellar biosynthesis protein FlhB [Pirellulales bacterium]
MEQSGEKTQDATPHRRQQAREEGRVAQSQDLAAAIILLIGLSTLMMMGSRLAEFMANLTQQQLGAGAWLSTDASVFCHQARDIMASLGTAIIPLFAVVWLAAVAAHLVQIGFVLAPNQAAPDLMRLDPLQGLQRLFSLSSLVRLGMGIVKIAIVTAVAFWVLYGRQKEIFAAAALDVPQIAKLLISIVMWTAIKIAAALVILALLDYLYQRLKFEQDLRMTRDEVREEMRNLQGDPQIISRRRAVQRQLVLNRLNKTVPKADVVITNPTELAVAIQYDSATMNAPILVAKGAGLLAARIRKLALESGVPIVERKPLAQAIYKDVDLNRPIPDTMYAAVAEVLAYVYQLKGKPLPKPG